jgi:hypothetical protein
MTFARRTEAALLNSMFGKTSDFGSLATAPGVRVALMTATPNKSGGGTEANYTSYARVQTSASDWTAANSTDPIKNGAELAFPESTGGNNLITHFALYDANTAGNLLAFGTLNASLTVTNGVQPKFAVGDLTVNIEDCS